MFDNLPKIYKLRESHTSCRKRNKTLNGAAIFLFLQHQQNQLASQNEKNRRCLQVSSAGGHETAGVHKRKPFQLSTRKHVRPGDEFESLALNVACQVLWCMGASSPQPISAGCLSIYGLFCQRHSAANETKRAIVFHSAAAINYLKAYFLGERNRPWLPLREDFFPAGWSCRLSGPHLSTGARKWGQK